MKNLLDIKEVRVVKYELETVACPLCNSDKYSVYIKDAKELYNNLNECFDVVQCDKCSHYFTNPRPTMQTIAYFYPDSAGYYKPVKPSKRVGLKQELIYSVLNEFYNYKINTKYNALTAYLLYPFVKKQLDILHIPKYVDNGNVLDIGCSFGNHLYRLKEYGWNVYGTEINEKAVDFAKDELDITTIKKDFFENTEFEDSFFDVVNMSMVLEHVYDPKHVLQKVNKVLKDDALLILSVPDISGFEAKVYKKYLYGLHVPQHLQHFTPKTITKVLEDNGFKVEKIVHHQFDRDLVASSGYLENKLLNKILSNKFFRKTFVRIFIKILSALGKTSRMSVYARKISA